MIREELLSLAPLEMDVALQVISTDAGAALAKAAIPFLPDLTFPLPIAAAYDANGDGRISIEEFLEDDCKFENEYFIGGVQYAARYRQFQQGTGNFILRLGDGVGRHHPEQPQVQTVIILVLLSRRGTFTFRR